MFGHEPIEDSSIRGSVCVCACWVASVMPNPLWSSGLQPTRLPCPWDSPGRNTAVGCHALLQDSFPIQGSNPCLWCLLHGRRVLHHSHHLGSPIRPTLLTESVSFPGTGRTLVETGVTPWATVHGVAEPDMTEHAHRHAQSTQCSLKADKEIIRRKQTSPTYA